MVIVSYLRPMYELVYNPELFNYRVPVAFKHLHFALTYVTLFV